MLQDGIHIRTEVGCNLERLLCTVFDLSIDAIKQQIQILFLDGKAVDDMESAVVGDGASLALSSAMPGLAGTALQRGGHLSSMRSGITHQGKNETIAPGKGRVSIKFFNLLISELGMPFLLKGICVGGIDLSGMLRSLSKALAAGAVKVTLDGRQIAADRLLGGEMISELEKEATWLFRVEKSEKDT